MEFLSTVKIKSMKAIWEKISTKLLIDRYGYFSKNIDHARPQDWDRLDWERMDPNMGRFRMDLVQDYLPANGLNLDIGTGAGHGTLVASRKCRCIGVDYGMASLEIARRKDLTLVQADGRGLPFADASFDSITCLDVLEHIPQAERAVAEAGRVLKPGGVFIVTTPTAELLSERLAAMARRTGLFPQMQPYDAPYPRQELLKMFYEAGLEVLHKDTIVNWVPNPFLRFITRARLFICRKPAASKSNLRKMRVLVLNYEFPPVGGGGGFASQEICSYLASQGHDVEVRTSWVKGLAKFKWESRYAVRRNFVGRRYQDKCRVYEMALYILFSILPGLVHCWRFKPQVIHCHFAVPTGVLAWILSKLSRVPYVLTAHLGDVPGGCPEQTDHLFKLVKPLTIPIWKSAASVTAVSAFVKDLAQQSYPAVPIMVVPNPVGIKPWPDDSLGANHPRKLVFAGRFSKQKNLLFSMELLNEVRDLDWHLDLLGNGPTFAKVHEKAVSYGLLDRMTFHNWVSTEEVERVISRGDILLLPSLSEGMPIVAVYAMVHGTPVLGSRIGGIGAVVEDGHTGYLCPVNDLESFQSSLRLLLTSDELLMEMKKNAQQSSVNFSLEAIGPTFERIFKETMDCKP
jgi:glycosyltransferase involved in cell wall biosynthesis/ubiquinone/menaquinone biosynthesis C-methylase UbiE